MQFDITIQNIPRCARLCFAICATSKTGKAEHVSIIKFNKIVIISLSEEKVRIRKKKYLIAFTLTFWHTLNIVQWNTDWFWNMVWSYKNSRFLTKHFNCQAEYLFWKCYLKVSKGVMSVSSSSIAWYLHFAFWNKEQKCLINRYICDEGDGLIGAYYKNPSWIWGWIRKYLPKDHRLPSQGLLSDDKWWSWGTYTSISPWQDNIFFLLTIKYCILCLKKGPRSSWICCDAKWQDVKGCDVNLYVT